MKTKLLIFIAFTFLISCKSQKQIMDSWLGSSKQNLIMSWGPPDRTASDGGTGEILVYAKRIYIPSSTFYDSYGGSSTTPARTYWDYKYIYVNNEGKIYYWMIRREEIPPTQIDLNIYKRY